MKIFIILTRNSAVFYLKLKVLPKKKLLHFISSKNRIAKIKSSSFDIKLIKIGGSETMLYAVKVSAFSHNYSSFFHIRAKRHKMCYFSLLLLDFRLFHQSSSILTQCCGKCKFKDVQKWIQVSFDPFQTRVLT